MRHKNIGVCMGVSVVVHLIAIVYMNIKGMFVCGFDRMAHTENYI